MNEVTENGEDSTGEEEEHQTAIKVKIKKNSGLDPAWVCGGQDATKKR